jgi:hypothetical protein
MPGGTGDFYRAGDSGSFVLDHEGHLVGLLFAGNEPRKFYGDGGGHGYVIPIGDIIDDIEACIGAKVSLP